MRVFTMLPMQHWREVGPFAAAVEGAGFDTLMTVELAHDPFAPLAIAALATARIELTPSIAVAFPRSPTIMASQAWDLQANSNGRFVLGLGSQVRGHNERRFGIAWSPPAPRLRDYVRALRAIWRCWETGEKLDYRGEHYKLTLMTPDFSPEPTGLPMVPVTIAAVGGAMLRVAGEVCDGVRLHPLCSRRYVEEVALPRLADGMGRSGRSRANFDVFGGGFVVTDPIKKPSPKVWSGSASASLSMARRAATCRSWHCTGSTSSGRNCMLCLSRGTGTRWPPRSRTRSCAFSRHAALMTKSPGRSMSGSAALPTRSK